jgi:hypothetical protein
MQHIFRSMPRLGGIDQLLEQAYTFIRCSLVDSSLEHSIGTHGRVYNE